MADWSSLDYDVLELITSKLELSDYLRLGAICKNWQLGVKATIYHPTHQLPWLVLGEERNTKKRVFFSLSEDKHYYIDIPELYGHICRGSSYGWLFTVDKDINGHVVNPFTRECYHLPPFPQLGEHFPDFRTLEGEERVYWQLKIVSKALFSGNPSENKDFTVVMLYGFPPKVAFWRSNNPNWALVESQCGLIHDIVFFKDKLYAVAASLRLMVVDLGSDPKMTSIEPWIPQYESSGQDYLVDFEGEFLVLIRRIQEEVEYDHYFTESFLIREFNLEERAMYEWHDIGGSVVFLGTSSIVVVDLNECSSCQPDSVYFTAINCLNYSDEKYGLDDHGFYDMVNKTIGKYYPREIFLTLQVSPIWFTPNSH